MKMYKTCKNDNCDYMNTVHKYNVTDKYCIKCGQPLYHVCLKCKMVLENNAAKYCNACLENIETKKQSRKDTAKNMFESVPNTINNVVAVGGTLAAAGASIKKVADVVSSKTKK